MEAAAVGVPVGVVPTVAVYCGALQLEFIQFTLTDPAGVKATVAEAAAEVRGAEVLVVVAAAVVMRRAAGVPVAEVLADLMWSVARTDHPAVHTARPDRMAAARDIAITLRVIQLPCTQGLFLMRTLQCTALR